MTASGRPAGARRTPTVRAGRPAIAPGPATSRHDDAVDAARRRARSAPRRDAIDLTVDLGRGLVLPNPILVASGTFGYGVEYGDVVDVDRLGGDLLQGHDAQGRGSATPRRG